MKSVAQKRPLKVFLCHAHSDQTRVRDLYNRLTKDGVDVWLDKEKLLAGSDWEFEIRAAVRNTDVVIVCHSNQFNQRGFRQKEVKIALEEADLLPKGQIFIIPARLEECEVLDDLQRWHWVDLFEENGYERLLRALRARADNIGATLQIKKSWFPKTTMPRKSETPVEKKLRKTTPPSKPNTAIIVAIIGLVGTLCAALITSGMLTSLFSRTPELTATLAFTPTKTKTPAPSKTPTKAYTPTLTPFPTEITDSKGITMHLVPAGEFTMGSENGDEAEKPVHQVYLDAFYMDIYEVTNVAYRACETARGCTSPQDTSSYTRSSYYGDSQYDNYPVINLDWNQATAYCEWRGASLPTEAQWEKAARGDDGRTYPWGEGIDSDYANYYSNVGDTTEVGSYEDGKSPYGMYDMAGNAWEWVADWHDSSYYTNSPFSNPLGPSSGTYRVLRGGSWSVLDVIMRTSYRLRSDPTNNHYVSVGFRCSRSP